MNDLLESLEYTISTYNKVTKKELLKIYKDNDIAVKKDKQLNLFSMGKVEINENNMDETIMNCFKIGLGSIQLFEIFNIKKSYKYSVLFKSKDFIDYSLIFANISEIIQDFKTPELSIQISDPTKLVENDKLYLLFNKKYEAFHPENGSTLILKYPIVVVFHLKSNIIEFRFDSIKKIFTGIDRDQNVYTKLVKELLTYLNDHFNITLIPVPLEKIITIASSDEFKGIKLCTQHMNFKNGGRAQLKTGEDGKYVMPFLGELRELMSEMSADLSKAPTIKEKLNNFIKDKEITSEYPLAEVDFLDKNNNPKRNNRVKFCFNYMNSGFCLVSYYYNNLLLGTERMDDVTNFIKENIIK